MVAIHLKVSMCGEVTCAKSTPASCHAVNPSTSSAAASLSNRNEYTSCTDLKNVVNLLFGDVNLTE